FRWLSRRRSLRKENEAGAHGVVFRLLWLPIARLIARILFCFTGGIKVRGANRVPSEGPVLILSNHLADIDPIAVQYGCSRPIHFMAKGELFDMKVVGPLLRLFKAFPVNRGEPDRSALRHSGELLKIGEVVGVFPEGQLSETGELQELKPGIALIVRMTDTPVICCK